MFYYFTKKVLNDGSVKKTVINPDSTVESYLLKENVLYDSNGNILATFNEDSEIDKSKSESQINPLFSNYLSDTSPYAISDYSIYKGMTSGNVVLEQSILTISTGLLAIIVGIIAPPVGVAISVMLIAEGATRSIDEYAIFYKKYEYHQRK